ncbi:nuclease-related domain-containing protein [Aquincola sp. J276]|uniref:nuclease-related domain-containing protein n=1 Tax=Aquincola sp. J276 TaxID=2898432 RepID=UPI002150B1A2|nr:nuclease-related domain-containing protein [Aquincola sp. J276]MCR5867937.1 NERD domain-containing protein [Aquincola sp. J276]
MLIKSAEDRVADIDALTQLLGRRDLTPTVRARIEQEIRAVRAGAKGEAEAAYEIDFYHRASTKWAVIHDLRLEHKGRVAQIDHLLISRSLDIWVCESKHFAEGVAVNDQGEFTAFYGGRAVGVPSPFEQNRKHIALLREVLHSDRVNLPKRLGIAIKPALESVVLVSKNARITRPRTKIDGLDRLIKTDQLRHLIEKTINEASAATTLLAVSKVVSQETMEDVARQLVRLHQPAQFNWTAKFGLAAAAAPAPVQMAHVQRAPAAAPSPAPAPPPAAAASTAPLPAMAVAPPLPPPAAAADPLVDPHEGRLSTSRLASARGLRSSKELLDRLVSAGLLAVTPEGGHVLTPAGQQAGGVFIAKSRFGPYFLWPRDLLSACVTLRAHEDGRRGPPAHRAAAPGCAHERGHAGGQAGCLPRHRHQPAAQAGG